MISPFEEIFRGLSIPLNISQKLHDVVFEGHEFPNSKCAATNQGELKTRKGKTSSKLAITSDLIWFYEASFIKYNRDGFSGFSRAIAVDILD
jgi:hypothetical protein